MQQQQIQYEQLLDSFYEKAFTHSGIVLDLVESYAQQEGVDKIDLIIRLTDDAMAKAKSNRQYVN